MGFPRITLARLMAVVVIAGLDCGLVRLFTRVEGGLFGLLGVGLALSAALAVVVLIEGSARDRALAFLAGGVLVAAVFYAAASVSTPVAMAVVDGIEKVFARLPWWLTDGRWAVEYRVSMPAGGPESVTVSYPTVTSELIVEALIGVPWLLAAWTCGWILRRVRRGTAADNVPAPAPGPEPTPVRS